jgi:hypothetical protein
MQLPLSSGIVYKTRQRNLTVYTLVLLVETSGFHAGLYTIRIGTRYGKET